MLFAYAYGDPDVYNDLFSPVNFRIDLSRFSYCSDLLI